jgi:putative acetyltransferase
VAAPLPTEPVVIRAYADQDARATLDVFLAAVTETAAADYSAEQIAAWSRPAQRTLSEWATARADADTFVAAVAGAVVGFSDVDADGYIDMMFVSPTHARRGVARALLAEVERRAGEIGARGLSTNASITARPFFEAHGFEVVAEQHPVISGVALTNFRMARLL